MANEYETIKNLQADEIEALSSIFGDDFALQGDNAFGLKIFNSSGREFYLQVMFPENYPLHSPPKYEISAPWMNRESKTKLCDELETITRLYKGESIIYMWTDFIRDFIEKDSTHLECNDCATHEQCTLEEECGTQDEVPVIMHGEIIKDRKSVFQAHLAKVGSLKQVNQVLENLKENKKIASAKHNIYAYRFKSEKNKIIQDCDDDGEAKAGPVLLHLLEVLNLTDTLIVVSRWFGGTLLGPIRFRHISDAAKSLIDQLGLVKEEKTDKSSGSKSKPV